MSSTFLRRGAVLVAVAALALAGCSDDGGNTSSPSGSGTPGASATPSGDAATPGVPATFATAATTCTPVEGSESKLVSAATLGGDLGTTPTITVDASYEVPEQGEVATLCIGDGPVLEEGNVATYLSRAVTIADGTELYVATAPGYMSVAKGELDQGALAGLTVGTRFAVTFPNDGTPAVQVYELVDVLAQDKFVTDAKVGDAGLPTVDAPQGEKPTVTLPEGGLATTAPGVTRVVLEEGDGDVVKQTDTIKAFYLGVNGSDGKEFDSSWTRGDEPSEFPLTGVIQGWTHGLEGLKVGTTVMLVIPPVLGYGTSPTSELATETLVFVVTIDSVVAAK